MLSNVISLVPMLFQYGGEPTLSSIENDKQKYNLCLLSSKFLDWIRRGNSALKGS
jgi:hypothetical protein